MSEHILVIEDDEVFAAVLQRALVKSGYTVDLATLGSLGLNQFHSHHPDLVVLDWLLPDIDGLEICQKIRTEASVPIMMLTGRRNLEDRVEGLDAGADDYLMKPVEIPEFLARIRALLRRNLKESQEVYTFADLSLDTSTRIAQRGDREIMLTSKEYDLLELFMKLPRKVLSRSLVYDRVWGYDFGGESNVLDVYVRYLREKLEADGEIRLIHTARGVGYVLSEKKTTYT